MEFIAASFQTDTGTIDWRLELGGTPIQFVGGNGSENLEADSTNDSALTDAASSGTAGQALTLVLSGAASSPTLFSLNIKVRRTS